MNECGIEDPLISYTRGAFFGTQSWKVRGRGEDAGVNPVRNGGPAKCFKCSMGRSIAQVCIFCHSSRQAGRSLSIRRLRSIASQKHISFESSISLFCFIPWWASIMDRCHPCDCVIRIAQGDADRWIEGLLLEHSNYSFRTSELCLLYRHLWMKH